MQIIAMLTMLIDHTGLVFFQDESLWRIIGRMAFPLYALGIVQGYEFTRSKGKYIKRLIVLALLSQLPFTWALGLKEANVIATFGVCLLVLIVLDRIRGSWSKVAVIALAILALEIIPFDYGGYALLLVLMYRYARSSHWIVLHLALNVLAYVYKGWSLQLFSLVPTMVFALCPQLLKMTNKIRVPRWLWRSFYPAHLAVLGAVTGLQDIIKGGGWFG